MTIDTQIPVIVENPLAACGCRKFQLHVMGDHLCTCTAHSGSKKAHDWVVDQLTDLFHTTHTVKRQHVTKSRGRHRGDIDLVTYLVNTTGPVSLVMDLLIVHDRFGSSSDLNLNGHLHLLHLCLLLLVRLGDYIVNLYDFYSYRLIGKLTVVLQP